MNKDIDKDLDNLVTRGKRFCSDYKIKEKWIQSFDV